MSDIAHQPAPQPSAAEALAALEAGQRAYRSFEHAHRALAILVGLEQNEREARERIAELHRQAEPILSDARERAERIVAEAQSKAEAATVEIGSEVARLREEETGVRASLAEAEAALAAALGEERAARERLSAVERETVEAIEERALVKRKLDEVKAELARIVGGGP